MERAPCTVSPRCASTDQSPPSAPGQTRLRDAAGAEGPPEESSEGFVVLLPFQHEELCVFLLCLRCKPRTHCLHLRTQHDHWWQRQVGEGPVTKGRQVTGGSQASGTANKRREESQARPVCPASLGRSAETPMSAGAPSGNKENLDEPCTKNLSPEQRTWVSPERRTWVGPEQRTWVSYRPNTEAQRRGSTLGPGATEETRLLHEGARMQSAA